MVGYFVEGGFGRDKQRIDGKENEQGESKEVMKIRRSRKGAYDMRMRRSTRNEQALILDLVTLTPGVAPPHPLHTFTHTDAQWSRTIRQSYKL